MRWLADECVDASLVRRLRAAGHDVLYVAELGAGAIDAEVLQRANEEDRLLLTEDKDFGELVFRSRQRAHGIILVRIAPEQRHLKWSALEMAIRKLGARMIGRYVVVEVSRFRSRPLRQPARR